MIHPNYTGPSRWFGLSKFNEAFNPHVTQKLEEELMIRKELLAAKEHFDAIHQYASDVANSYKDPNAYSIPKKNSVVQ